MPWKLDAEVPRICRQGEQQADGMLCISAIPQVTCLHAALQVSEDKMLAVQSLAALLELDAHAGLYHLLQPGSTAPLGMSC